MTYFQYRDSPFPIRQDLQDSYRQYWDALSRPGTWFSGEERIAIAGEVRYAIDCPFCDERRQALSPYAISGEHTSGGTLDQDIVDVVHRIITDQSRITASYIEDNGSKGLSEARYVEILGIAVTVFSIDEFNRALGLRPENLPEPMAGEPSRYLPQQATRDGAFVSMLPLNGATGEESDLWKNGRTGNVIRATSLVPNALREWFAVASAQYMSPNEMLELTGNNGRALDRMQIELIASRVSSVNQCFY